MSILFPIDPTDFDEDDETVPLLQGEGVEPRTDSLVDAVLDAVRGEHKAELQYEGITFRETSGNVVAKILQTPNLWGAKPDYSGQGMMPGKPVVGAELVTEIRETIKGATHAVDILTMWPFPDGHFLEAIRGGLIELTKVNGPVVVRILIGKNVVSPPTFDPLPTLRAWFDELRKGVSGGQLSVYVGFLMTSTFSWNHAKVIAVDGKTAIVGGHNLWSDDYLGFAPVHDVSVKVTGPAAYDAHQFANALWRFADDWVNSKDPTARVWSLSWQSGAAGYVTGACRDIGVVEPNGTAQGGKVLSLGRLGKGMTPKGLVPHATQASDTAKLVAARWAKHSIKLSQQDLVTSAQSFVGTTLGQVPGVGKALDTLGAYLARGTQWAKYHPFIHELAKALLRGVEVYIVMSPADARTAAGSPYTTGVGVADTIAAIKWSLSRHAKSGSPEYNAALQRLHIAPIHFTGQGTEWKWTDPTDKKTVRTTSIQNHAKVYIVDDQAFYVGSDNLYPYAHQEFGYLIEDPEITRRFLREYWNQLWYYSKQHQVKV